MDSEHNLSESENSDRKYFGKLGIFLINKAKDEIRELSKQTLFQKTEIRKRILETISQRSIKMRKNFKETYLKFLNNSLSTTINNAKEKSLKLENLLLKDLKEEIFRILEQKIEHKYSKYQAFLENKLRDAETKLQRRSQMELILNHKDYGNDKITKAINDIFGKNIKIRKDKEDFLGGFKIQSQKKNLTYDFTLSTAIKRNNKYIEKKFSKIFCDAEVKRLEDEFIDFIKNQRNNIRGYLEEYDRI